MQTSHWQLAEKTLMDPGGSLDSGGMGLRGKSRKIEASKTNRGEKRIKNETARNIEEKMQIEENRSQQNGKSGTKIKKIGSRKVEASKKIREKSRNPEKNRKKTAKKPKKNQKKPRENRRKTHQNPWKLGANSA